MLFISTTRLFEWSSLVVIVSALNKSRPLWGEDQSEVNWNSITISENLLLQMFGNYQVVYWIQLQARINWIKGALMESLRCSAERTLSGFWLGDRWPGRKEGLDRKQMGLKWNKGREQKISLPRIYLFEQQRNMHVWTNDISDEKICLVKVKEQQHLVI